MKRLATLLSMTVLAASVAIAAPSNTQPTAAAKSKAKDAKYVKRMVAEDPTLSLHKVKWKGKKWEYLVEHPTETRHVDTVRFEEILDTAGQHGWRLVTVSHAFHFYGFYFERPLPDSKLAAHRAHLAQSKAYRAKNMAKTQRIIDESVQARIKNEKQMAAELQQVNKELKQEDIELKAVNKDMQKK